jgi:hypothetical protein
MTRPGGVLVRRAGRGRTAAGETVWWTVAQGRRGRRWREAIVAAGGLRHSLLLETSPEGRFSHLELSTPAGLLTLHPEPDGTLHGNALADGGLRHVNGVPWAADGLVLLAGSPVARAAAAHLLRATGVATATHRRLVLWISPALQLTSERAALEPLGNGRWRLAESPGADAVIDADTDDLPSVEDAQGWPLDLPE